jgi:two-component system cell cycle response regulator DivK
MKKIVVIEDNQQSLDMIAEILKYHGYDVFKSKEAEAGIEIAKQERPDLILMDMSMPFLDGYDATRILKSDRQMADIPVIAFTAFAMSEEKQRALQSGCDDFISKPLVMDDFLKTISKHANRNHHT